MTLDELKSNIEFIKECQFAFMRANNLRWHYDKDISGGYNAIAEIRYKSLVEAEMVVDRLRPKYNELEKRVEEQFILSPDDKMLEILNKYFLISSITDYKIIEKYRLKISKLEGEFFKPKQHIVIITKNQSNVFSANNKEFVYKCIQRVVNSYKGKLIGVNGMPNHIHILLEVSAKKKISEIVEKIKEEISLFAKDSILFPQFDGWDNEYAIQEVSWDDSERVIKEIKSQEDFHTRISFEDEYRNLLNENEVKVYKV